jgi:hypothetical protein
MAVIFISSNNNVQLDPTSKEKFNHTHDELLDLNGKNKMTSAITFVPPNGTESYLALKTSIDNNCMILTGGSSWLTGGSIALYGNDAESANDYNGGIVLYARYGKEQNDYKALVLRSDGLFSWDGKHVVRSVNRTLADSEGNVQINPIPIENNSDLNNFKTNGLYTAQVDLVAVSLYNCPIKHAFLLEVFSISSTIVFQRLTDYTNCNIFLRRWYGADKINKWSIWKKIDVDKTFTESEIHIFVDPAFTGYSSTQNHEIFNYTSYDRYKDEKGVLYIGQNFPFNSLSSAINWIHLVHFSNKRTKVIIELCSDDTIPDNIIINHPDLNSEFKTLCIRGIKTRSSTGIVETTRTLSCSDNDNDKVTMCFDIQNSFVCFNNLNIKGNKNTSIGIYLIAGSARIGNNVSIDNVSSGITATRHSRLYIDGDLTITNCRLYGIYVFSSYVALEDLDSKKTDGKNTLKITGVSKNEGTGIFVRLNGSFETYNELTNDGAATEIDISNIKTGIVCNDLGFLYAVKDFTLNKKNIIETNN